MATPTNKFYTIVNLNRYKEKFALNNGSHKNDKESTIDLKEIFDDNTENSTIKTSNNNLANTVPKGFYIAAIQADSNNIGQSLTHFELKGLTPQQYQIPDAVGSFEASNITTVQQSIKNANNVGFGHGTRSNYKEFGDEIMPGNQTKIQQTNSYAFVRGIKGAQGGSGGSGGGRSHAVRKKGGSGGDSGGSYSAWVYPITSISSKNVEFGTDTKGQGGHAGREGEWGVYSGEDGGGGGKGGDTSFGFQVDTDSQNENAFTITIQGSDGGGGGEKGKYGQNGNSAGPAADGPTPQFQGGGAYGFITSSSVSTPKEGAQRRSYGQDGRDGTKGDDGLITNIIYLAGSRNSHIMD